MRVMISDVQHAADGPGQRVHGELRSGEHAAVIEHLSTGQAGQYPYRADNLPGVVDLRGRRLSNRGDDYLSVIDGACRADAYVLDPQRRQPCPAHPDPPLPLPPPTPLPP